MIPETVLLAPGDGIGGIYIGIVVAAFSVVHTFYPFGTRARLAVFNAARKIILYVLNGAAYFGGFAQFIASSIVEELDGIASAERDQLRKDTIFWAFLEEKWGWRREGLRQHSRSSITNLNQKIALRYS